jgi:seryl-tRNA synthetase
VCHPLYGTLPPDVPPEGLDEECSGWSFRHEPSLDPARMQIFRIYEFVRVGTPEQSLAHRDEWLERGLAALTELGLPVRSEAANDPFFGRVGRMLAVNQLDSQLKYEMCLDLTEVKPTAIGSSNYHEDHFGHTFGLQLADGTPAHSACIGFGLDRVTLALFAIHGMKLEGWPGEVRSALELTR